MRHLPLPTQDQKTVFQECMLGVADNTLRDQYEKAESTINSYGNRYSKKAATGQLFTIPANDGKKNDLVILDLTKEDLYKLYSNYFRGKTKPARRHYDSLLMSIPSQVCPYCGFGHVWTLDHYLPKSKYPQFSLLIKNLVPACRDCNEGCKNTIYSTSEGDQPLHPYFDGGDFITKQWIFAEILKTSPTTAKFYTKCPPGWSAASIARAEHHFKSFGLEGRFGVEAGKELSGLSPRLEKYHAKDSAEQIREILSETLDIEQGNHVNAWKTALYDGLIKSTWYCNGGFKLK